MMADCKRCFLKADADHTPSDCIAALRSKNAALSHEVARLDACLREWKHGPMPMLPLGTAISSAAAGTTTNIRFIPGSVTGAAPGAWMGDNFIPNQ